MRERQALLAEMRPEAAPHTTYFALAAASCAIATFGLLENSAPVIIGAMLIAPLMTPIVALALAIVVGDLRLLRDSGSSLLLGSLLAVALSTAIAALIRLPVPGPETLARGHPNLLDLGIALSAGAIAGYARKRKDLTATVGGAAIAVALMPPLCVVGIGLSLLNRELAYGAFLLFVTNLIGITFACASVFVASRLATRHAGRGLITSGIIMTLIAVPLGFATLRLLQQQRLEVAFRAALLNQTQTFKRVELVNTSIDWLATPIQIRLLVRSQAPITPTQVGFLQAFAERRLGSSLQLVIEVSPVGIVTASPSPSPASAFAPSSAP